MLIQLFLMMTVLIKMLMNFNNKLMCLILIECMFLITMLNNIMSKNSNLSMMIFITMTIFMVLDSTMGLSILITSSRNSSLSMNQFKNI